LTEEILTKLFKSWYSDINFKASTGQMSELYQLINDKFKNMKDKVNDEKYESTRISNGFLYSNKTCVY
jgi:hypothetical protein